MAVCAPQTTLPGLPLVDTDTLLQATPAPDSDTYPTQVEHHYLLLPEVEERALSGTRATWWAHQILWGSCIGEQIGEGQCGCHAARAGILGIF